MTCRGTIIKSSAKTSIPLREICRLKSASLSCPWFQNWIRDSHRSAETNEWTRHKLFRRERVVAPSLSSKLTINRCTPGSRSLKTRCMASTWCPIDSPLTTRMLSTSKVTRLVVRRARSCWTMQFNLRSRKLRRELTRKRKKRLKIKSIVLSKRGCARTLSKSKQHKETRMSNALLPALIARFQSLRCFAFARLSWWLMQILTWRWWIWTWTKVASLCTRPRTAAKPPKMRISIFSITLRTNSFRASWKMLTAKAKSGPKSNHPRFLGSSTKNSWNSSQMPHQSGPHAKFTRNNRGRNVVQSNFHPKNSRLLKINRWWWASLARLGRWFDLATLMTIQHNRQRTVTNPSQTISTNISWSQSRTRSTSSTKCTRRRIKPNRRRT